VPYGKPYFLKHLERQKRATSRPQDTPTERTCFPCTPKVRFSLSMGRHSFKKPKNSAGALPINDVAVNTGILRFFPRVKSHELVVRASAKAVDAIQAILVWCTPFLDKLAISVKKSHLSRNGRSCKIGGE
jgi:hypothetical protein